MSRTIVVGDIHGCFDELTALLDLVRLSADDRVIAVGDLVTKGNKSQEVLDLFAGNDRFESVIGNQDLSLLRYWQGETTHLTNSQAKTAAELETNIDRNREYLSSLPLMIDLGAHLVVHAGIRPGVPLSDQDIDDLTELRTLGKDRTKRKGTPWYEVYDSEKTVLFGHWPNATPIQAPHAIGLDTGCVYGNRLTSYIVESHEFVSVPALRAYDRPNKGLAAAGSN